MKIGKNKKPPRKKVTYEFGIQTSRQDEYTKFDYFLQRNG